MKRDANFKLEIAGKNENAVRFKLKKGDAYLSFSDVFTAWKTDDDFIHLYVAAIKKLNYQAFYWEHPALKSEFLSCDYECILQRSKPLETLKSNETAFKKYIHNALLVEDFRNLGKDARLVVPTKRKEGEIYNHLGRFMRFADADQIVAVFRRVGEIAVDEIKQRETVWLNTAGLGVIWLHIRFDTRPKYYKTSKYRDSEYLKKTITD
ncbi:MAG: hypothetical protein AB8G22_11320 [Saprospiraceae bacterium]